MAFTVRFSGQPQPQDYGEDDGFEFLAGGVLAIHFGDEYDDYEGEEGNYEPDEDDAAGGD